MIGLSDDELRVAMRERFKAMSMREWCRLTKCNLGHVSEFVNGHRGPPSDMLNALNMTIRYVKRNRRTQPGATTKGVE